jgi:hypothetical protein
MECTYCVKLFICIIDLVIGSLSFNSNLFIDGMCVVALAHATKTMNVAILQSLVVMLLMSG